MHSRKISAIMQSLQQKNVPPENFLQVKLLYPQQLAKHSCYSSIHCRHYSDNSSTKSSSKNTRQSQENIVNLKNSPSSFAPSELMALKLRSNMVMVLNFPVIFASSKVPSKSMLQPCSFKTETPLIACKDWANVEKQ